jgi:hypothetical protein
LIEQVALIVTGPGSDPDQIADTPADLGVPVAV